MAFKPKVSASEWDNEDKIRTLESKMGGEWASSRWSQMGMCTYHNYQLIN